MARSPRVIAENKLYEIVPRTREGLPLPPNKTTEELLLGILGRTQRDDKVTLCNYVWMNNHAHLHVLPTSSKLLPCFYGEMQKKVTDTLRALLREKSLRIWEDRTGVILLAGLEDAINRLVYLFCNPATAGLVETIDEFPGINSWQAFNSCPPDVEAEVLLETRWHPVSTLPALPLSRKLLPYHDLSMCEQLKSSAGSNHVLKIKPLAWLTAYGVSDPSDVEVIRQTIVRRVREREAHLKEERTRQKQRVIGAIDLSNQIFLAPHQPSKKSRKIFLICADALRRKELIRHFQGIFKLCGECYQQAKRGLPALWPDGTFIPWLPPILFHSFEA